MIVLFEVGIYIVTKEVTTSLNDSQGVMSNYGALISLRMSGLTNSPTLSFVYFGL